MTRNARRPRNGVSIPFKREGTSKLDINDLFGWASELPFQFPSNGKAHLNIFGTTEIIQISESVSIPFKREGTSKPSPKSAASLRRVIVSIPFKREGTSKLLKIQPNIGQATMFQFPSNGKAHLNMVMDDSDLIGFEDVSIPFKREGTSKLSEESDANSLEAYEFQFPSNGKAHLNQYKTYVMKNVGEMFQFPSNGKAHLNRWKGSFTRTRFQVSIPFKREGTSKQPLF